MAIPQSLVEDAHELIQNLYTSGTRHDLLIRSAKKGTKHYKEFKVHKCIVYPSIPILEAIQIKNRDFTIVKLAEPASVVDAMLRHVYKLPIECVPVEGDGEEELKGTASLESLELAIELRKAGVESQFDIPSLLPLTELIIGNCLHRITLRAFEPKPVRVSSRFREVEEKPPEEARILRRQKREAAQIQAAKDKPLVDFTKMIVALEKRHEDESCRPFRLAALFLLATKMPRILNCGKAVTVVQSIGWEFYQLATNLAFDWLKWAKKGESERDRKAAAEKLFESCAEYIGIEWKMEFLEEWLVFRPAAWGEERDPWRRAMLEGEQYES